MATLQTVIEGYYRYRGYACPDPSQALLFLVSEVGELADAHVHGQADWVRNTAGKERSIPAEIGDVMMMLAVYAASQGVDPVGAMLDKMRRCGYAPPPDDTGLSD